MLGAPFGSRADWIVEDPWLSWGFLTDPQFE